jgi:hypothetical protein
METQNITPTPASQWKTKARPEGQDIPLPSGNVARVRSLAPDAFLSSGLIPQPLMPLIQKAIHTKKGLNPKDLERQLGGDDPTMLGTALELFDRVLSYCMMEPGIEMPPPCIHCSEYANKPQHQDRAVDGYHRYVEGDRDKDILYADQVDMEDKMFIFQWALGGTNDLREFRDQLEAGVEATPGRQGVQLPAK